MFYLLTSVIILFAGPWILSVQNEKQKYRILLSGISLSAIFLLIFLDLLPSYFEKGGWMAIPAAIAGVAAPVLLELVFHSKKHQMHQLTYLPAAAALCLHSLLDGSMLADVQSLMPVAVIMHQLPVSMALPFLFAESSKSRLPYLVALMMSVTTIAGYLSVQTIMPSLNPVNHPLLGGLFSGFLLHVFIHPAGRSRISFSLQNHRYYFFIGVFLGVLLFIGLHYGLH